jgi:hypothetical protein
MRKNERAIDWQALGLNPIKKPERMSEKPPGPQLWGESTVKNPQDWGIKGVEPDRLILFKHPLRTPLTKLDNLGLNCFNIGELMLF